LTRLARVLLVAVLLAGWQAALLHPLQHVDEGGSFVHLADGHSGNPQSEQCDVLAALTACASPAPASLAPVSSVQPLPDFSGSELRAAQAPPFLSRGPPAVL
jgi:hypothetical protein